MDLFAQTREQPFQSIGRSNLASVQLDGTGSGWSKHVARDMENLGQGISSFGRHLTTKKQREKGGDIALDAAKAKANPGGAAVDSAVQLTQPHDPLMRAELTGAGKKKKPTKAEKQFVNTASKLGVSQDEAMVIGASAGAGGVVGAAGGPVGAAAGATGGAVGKYVEQRINPKDKKKGITKTVTKS